MKGKYKKPIPNFLKNNNILEEKNNNKKFITCSKCNLTYLPSKKIQKNFCIRCFNKIQLS